MNRLLIENIEGRILLGVTMFVAIMILVGWVAINEPARMASFDRQFLARSIERGAELFAANCSTCHGPNGLGIAGRAPALNNPHLFGYNYLGEINDQIGRLERRIAVIDTQLATLADERAALFDEVAKGPTPERQAEIVARIREIDALNDSATAESPAAAKAALQTELDPLLAQREAQLAELQVAIDGGFLPEFETALAEGGLTFTNFISVNGTRMGQIGWGGDLEGYVRTTLIHGRPGSGDVWDGNVMAAWSNLAGGPLSADKIDDITNYILNWDKGEGWTLDDFYTVQQYAKLHGGAAAPAGVETVGTDVAAIVAALPTVTGDAARGERLYSAQEATGARNRLGCAGCHAGGAQAPNTIGTWTRIQNERLTLPEFADYTAEQYLVESIVMPNNYIVAPYAGGVMIQTYGQQLTVQDLADIVAYLQTQN